MAGSVRITSRVQGLTLERAVFKQLGGYLVGAVERTLDQNRDLAGVPDLLPPGTSFEVPQPSAEELGDVIAPIRLVD